jgi:hypothetical protein
MINSNEIQKILAALFSLGSEKDLRVASKKLSFLPKLTFICWKSGFHSLVLIIFWQIRTANEVPVKIAPEKKLELYLYGLFN